ncbi:MAG: DUF5686 and carboxypeptidase regulatory-like domain-containing protein [Ginsengibacter sp.]
MSRILFLFFLFGTLNTSAQRIEGTVKDDQGNILPFASILVKGTAMGVTANNHGEFSIALSPGKYVLDCRYVGYLSQEKEIVLKNETVKTDFTLSLQRLTLKEVVIQRGGEDPAYEIIRQAIKKRPEYEKQVKAYQVMLYMKGIIKLKHLPKAILGKKIPDEDRESMGLDSSGKGIIYLSESVAKISAQEPDKAKLEVISSRVSGSQGFGFDVPITIDLNKNNINSLPPQVSARGFVSPIADGALNFYKYKLMGIFFEGSSQVNVIKVTPKRDYEPLFSGIINITENDWRIYSFDLLLTKKSQLQFIDSLKISQIHIPVQKDIWRLKNQVMSFNIDVLGIKAGGDFVNVYSDYNLQPVFPKKFFNNVIMKYDTAVNKKTHEYWDTVRPVPLEPEEIKDYIVKDSLLKESIKKDSLRREGFDTTKHKGPSITDIFWPGINTRLGKKRLVYFQAEPLLKSIQFNTVEGLAIEPSIVFNKYVKSLKSNVSFIADVRYGFNNQHLNPWAGIKFTSRELFNPDVKPKLQAFFFAGGKRVSQFYKESQIDGLSNTIGSLLYGRNLMKIYENYFAKAGYTKAWESSARLRVEVGYEDRIPLNNTTDYIWNKKWLYRYTPNYPTELLNSQFIRHQAVLIHTSFSIKPGQKYIQFPKYKMAVGSKLPTFTVDYTKGIKQLFGSDVDYDKWSLAISDDANLKLGGSIKYNLTFGGFLNTNAVQVQDYNHFNSTISHVAGEYVKTFQNATPYYFSNTSSFYTEFHFEHHSNGLLTNKIPLFKRLNWNLVEGTNALYINPNRKYAEVFVGLENIFKLLRIDAVMGLQNGMKPVFTYRVGFGGILGDSFNLLRFNKRNKIIDEW